VALLRLLKVNTATLYSICIHCVEWVTNAAHAVMAGQEIVLERGHWRKLWENIGGGSVVDSIRIRRGYSIRKGGHPLLPRGLGVSSLETFEILDAKLCMLLNQKGQQSANF